MPTSPFTSARCCTICTSRKPRSNTSSRGLALDVDHVGEAGQHGYTLIARIYIEEHRSTTRRRRSMPPSRRTRTRSMPRRCWRRSRAAGTMRCSASRRSRRRSADPRPGRSDRRRRTASPAASNREIGLKMRFEVDGRRLGREPHHGRRALSRLARRRARRRRRDVVGRSDGVRGAARAASSA